MAAIWIKLFNFDRKMGLNLFIYKNIVEQS